MRFLTALSTFLITAPLVASSRGGDGNDADHDVVADLGEDLAARILKEREQLKRQNKELRQKLSVAQRYADQRAAMLAAQNRAEHNKVSNLQETLTSVQGTLHQAQKDEQHLQQLLHENGIAVPLPPQSGGQTPMPRRRPVASLQQSSSQKPSHKPGKAPSRTQKHSHPKVSKAALTAIRTQLAAATYARKKEGTKLTSLQKESATLENTYEHESAELKIEINESNALLATVKSNAKLLEQMRARLNHTTVDVSRDKQALSLTKQQIQHFQQLHKHDIASLKDLNSTTRKLRDQFNKLNSSLTKVQQRAMHDEDVQNNETKKMKATLDKKLNLLNHTVDDLEAKIAKAKNNTARDADKTDELHRRSKGLVNDDRDTRWEARQQKEHIADLSKLVNELEHNLTQAKKAKQIEDIRARNETSKMKNGAAKRIQELTKMVSDSKKKLEKRKADNLANEKKAEVKENATLKDGLNKIQKVKKEINTELKVIADSEKEVKKDMKAANVDRNKIADLRDTISQKRQKMETLEAYVGNAKNDLSEVKTQLQGLQNATKKQKAKMAKAEGALQTKLQSQRKSLQAAEVKVKAKLKEEKDLLDKAEKDGKEKAAAKQKLVQAETATDKKIQSELNNQYKKGNQTQKEHVLKQKKLLEEKKALEAKITKDKADVAALDKKAQDMAAKGTQEAKDAAAKQKSKEEAKAKEQKKVSDLEKEKETLEKEVEKLEGAPKMDAAAASLRAQIAASKASAAEQDKAKEAAEERAKKEDKSLLQEEKKLASIQAQFQQASASLAASQQSAQATEAGSTESWQRLSQATAERDALAQQLRSTSAKSLPWIQAEAKAQAQVKQLRGKLQKVQADDSKHKAMLSKLLTFSRSQKAKLKALLSVMTPAQRKHLHV